MSDGRVTNDIKRDRNDILYNVRAVYKSTSELGTLLSTGQPAGNILPMKDVLYREVPLCWVRLLNHQFGALYIYQLQADRLSNPTGCCCYAGVGEVQRSNCFAFSHGKLDSSPETTHSWLCVKQLGRVHTWIISP